MRLVSRRVGGWNRQEGEKTVDGNASGGGGLEQLRPHQGKHLALERPAGREQRWVEGVNTPTSLSSLPPSCLLAGLPVADPSWMGSCILEMQQV